MKTTLFLALLLAGLLDSALPTPAQATATVAGKASPNHLARMRRHLHRQAMLRVRQNRHR